MYEKCITMLSSTMKSHTFPLPQSLLFKYIFILEENQFVWFFFNILSHKDRLLLILFVLVRVDLQKQTATTKSLWLKK